MYDGVSEVGRAVTLALHGRRGLGVAKQLAGLLVLARIARGFGLRCERLPFALILDQVKVPVTSVLLTSP